MTLKKRTNYPTKTTLNLVVRERSAQQTKSQLLFFAAFLLFLSIFVRFAVLAPLSDLRQMDLRVMETRQQLDMLISRTAEYNEISREYQRYFPADTGELVTEGADCMEVLALLEIYFIPNSGVVNASLDGSTLTVQLSRVTLEEAHTILALLEESPLVDAVSLSTANAATPQIANEQAIVTMSIALHSTEGGVLP